MKKFILIAALLAMIGGCKSSTEKDVEFMTAKINPCKEAGLKPEVIWDNWTGNHVICK